LTIKSDKNQLKAIRNLERFQKNFFFYKMGATIWCNENRLTSMLSEFEGNYMHQKFDKLL